MITEIKIGKLYSSHQYLPIVVLGKIIEADRENKILYSYITLPETVNRMPESLAYRWWSELE